MVKVEEKFREVSSAIERVEKSRSVLIGTVRNRHGLSLDEFNGWWKFHHLYDDSDVKNLIQLDIKSQRPCKRYNDISSEIHALKKSLISDRSFRNQVDLSCALVSDVARKIKRVSEISE